MSHPVAMSVMRNGIFCTATIGGKTREPVANAHAITSGQDLFQSGPLPVTSFPVNAASGHVTFGDVISGSFPFAPHEIRLEPFRYATRVLLHNV